MVDIVGSIDAGWVPQRTAGECFMVVMGGIGPRDLLKVRPRHLDETVVHARAQVSPLAGYDISHSFISPHTAEPVVRDRQPTLRSVNAVSASPIRS
jgi:hypothetical protein